MNTVSSIQNVIYKQQKLLMTMQITPAVEKLNLMLAQLSLNTEAIQASLANHELKQLFHGVEEQIKVVAISAAEEDWSTTDLIFSLLDQMISQDQAVKIAKAAYSNDNLYHVDERFFTDSVSIDNDEEDEFFAKLDADQEAENQLPF